MCSRTSCLTRKSIFKFEMRTFIFIFASFLALHFAAASEKKVVCYFGSWAVYRQGKGQFHISDIDASLCTHFIYAFATLKGNQIATFDAWADLPDGGGKNGYKLFMDTCRKNPSAKISIAIGGWNDSQGSKYSVMAAYAESRKEFVGSVVAFLKKYNFDGLDVDWEYPTRNGGKPSDRDNFIALIKELRAALNKEKRILSVAVAALEGTASQAYKIAELSKHVDMINIMAYDFHGSWEKKTGHHASLHGQMSIESAVKFWTSQGCEKEKLVIGIPTYGRAWTLANPKNCAVGAPASGAAKPGPYTKEPSMLGYNEICYMTRKEGWMVQFDKKAVAAIAFKGDQWVGYDNIESVNAKCNFIKDSGLGGAMIWSLETDDFLGTCGVKYPILKTIDAVLRSGKPVPEEEMPTAPAQPEEEPQPKKHHSHPKTKKNKDEGSAECTQEGLMRADEGCGYNSCVAKAEGGFIKYDMPCPDDLCFNEEKMVCDWPQ